MNPEHTEARRRGRPPVNQQSRESTRPVALGRDGKPVTRRRVGNTDIFAVPPHIIPDGWDYQWNPHTITGQPATDQMIEAAENGWEPVPSDRHDGMFMQKGYKGPIIRGGMRLDERPMQLTLEAKEEEYQKAQGQMRDQNALISGSLNSRLGMGSEQRSFNGNSRAAGHGIRQDIDAAVDAPRAQYNIDAR